MLKLDPNDPLDRMILKELDGAPVLFDEWLDAMDKLSDEPDCEQILRDKGLEREAVLRDAREYRTDFRTRLAEMSISANDRFTLCCQLNEQAQAAPSFELLRIFCELLCDLDFLLDYEPTTADEEEQTILQYLSFMRERDALLQTLLRRGALAGKFVEVTKEKRSPKPVDCDTERKYEILQCFTALFDIPTRGSGDILLHNLTHYIRVAAASPILKPIEPLLIFRLLTRRQSYMCSTADLAVELSALWKPDHNKIDADNGRNFRQYRTNLQLFMRLCRIYERDTQVDIPLCWYGLDQITVLGNFYRQEIAAGWTYSDEQDEVPFPPIIEELVEDALFTCFKHGGGDNILLTDGGITSKELLDYQCSGHPAAASLLERISAYMNTHAVELTNQFLQADPSGVKHLCRNILEKTTSGAAVSAQNVPFLLASINEGLMELQDYFASQYLTQAGQALTAGSLTRTPE